jgi:hypothetical protein
VRARLLTTLVVTLILAAPGCARASIGWFELDRTSNTSSTLRWKYALDNDMVYTGASWRAGTGSTTACNQIGRGWLPVGWYDTWGHWNNYDGLIKGRVFYLQDKRCGDGTLRTELFIHSEETASTGQYCPTSGDDPYCWEGWTDYYSNGCIKLAHANAGFPDAIGAAHWEWHNRFGSPAHGSYGLYHRLYVG